MVGMDAKDSGVQPTSSRSGTVAAMAGRATTWQRLPAALLLLAMLSAAPLLRFYANNLHEGLSPREIGAYTVVWTASVLVLYTLLHALLRPTGFRLTALFATTLVVCMSYYDLASELAAAGASYALQNGAFFALLFGAIGAAAWAGARAGFRHFLFLLAGIGLLVPALRILSYEAPERGPQLPLAQAYPLAGNAVWSGEAAFTPNVYWLVVDSYPNREVLRSHYGFDNGPFLKELAERGFYVADESYANFSTTRLSVPTTLDMQYVVGDGERYSEDRGSVHVRLPGRTNSGMIAAVAGDNRSVAYFRQLGYRYVHVEGNSFHLTRCRGREDVCIRGGGLSELQLSLLSLLPIRPVLGLLRGKPPGLRLVRSPSESGTGIPELGQALRELELDAPFFLYAHFASPHPPFYNDAQCRRSPDNYPIDRPHFTQQLQCVNRQLDELLRQIEADDPGAIVVLSSDHGPRLSVKRNLPTHALKPGHIAESLGILNAFRLPEHCRAGLHPAVSPVNSMRIVFACLGSHPPRLVPDEHFVARPSADRGILRRVEVD
jgi:hypothetical protein